MVAISRNWEGSSDYNIGMQNQILIPTLTTPRLTLRAWTLEDAPQLFDILQQKDILRYFPNQVAPSIDKVQRYIRHHQDHWQVHGWGHWAVASQKTGAVLGWVGLEYLEDVQETEVAYLLSNRAWGRGLASEAASATVRYGFEQAGLQKIIGLVHPENIASARVLQKSALSFHQRVTLWGMELDWYQADNNPQ
jgi:RimJ/RimL family protein N-acetyltransferase